jgi:hypothetical protein
MSYRIRYLAPEDKDCQHLRLDLVEPIIPLQAIEQVLDETKRWEQRVRKLSMVSMIYFVIGLGFWANLSYKQVLYKLSQALRFLRRQSCEQLPTSHALSSRRQQLGSAPLQLLFERCCHVRATPETPGAFRFGLRLMALDSTIENVPDTPANASAFGRPCSQHGPGAFPQVKGTYLLECGTHLLVAAQFTPWRRNERLVAPDLLRQVPTDSLLTWDAGLHSYALVRQLVVDWQRHLLGRLPADILTPIVQVLPDGSYLTDLLPESARTKGQEPLRLRVIEYTITDPALPGYGQRHRLLTSLLDPDLAPALDLIDCDHERWEIEIAIDEIDTHQRLARHTLRSKTPEGVRQELYGLLLGYYAVRALMLDAAQSQALDVDRLSFTHALCVIECALPEFQLTDPVEHPALHERLQADLLAGQLPARRLRTNPRVVKRKRSKFLLKREQHRHPTQPLAERFVEVVCVIPPLYLAFFALPLLEPPAPHNNSVSLPLLI